MAVPNSIRCQFIANLSPMRCQSDQSVSNPVQIRRQPSINQMPNQCQSIANLRPIRTQAMAIQFRSTADPKPLLPIQCRSRPIPSQSSVNPAPIQHQSIPTRCQPFPNPRPIRCQSSANPVPIECQFIPIGCQSDVNPVPILPIHCQSDANPA